MKIVGIKRSNFTTEDKTEITGYNVYCTYPIEKDKGEGFGTDRLYITDRKLQNTGYMPKVGDEIRVEYNRYGKVAGIEKAGG